MDTHAHSHEHDTHNHDHPLLKFFDFSLPRQEINAQRAKKLAQLAKTAKLSGFRPGKVPMNVMEKRFGDSAFADIVEEMAKAHIQEKMKGQSQEKLASRVTYHPSGENERDILFHAHYEIFPEFELALNTMPVVKKPAVKITEQSVDEMIAWMCRLYGDNESANEIGPSDRVTMNFEMKEGDRSVLKIDPYQFVVPWYHPSKYIDFPADALIGKKVGETAHWTHTYANDFANPLVAGKSINLSATIQSIVRKVPLDAEVLFERLGIKDKSAEERRADIRKQIDSQLEKRIKSTVSTRIGKALQSAHAHLEVPPSMHNAELQNQGERVRVDITALEKSKDDRDHALLARLSSEAKEALQTQILWLKVSEKIGKVERDEIEQELRRQCEDFENPEAVFQEVLKNREAVESAFNVVQQNKMIEWLTPQIKIVDDEVAFTEFMIG